VTVVDASEKKRLELRIEVPIEDMARLAAPVAIPSGPAAQGPARASVWSSIHPRLLELIGTHRSTLLFVNSRRLAERLAGALNELAGAALVRSHHGSLARESRSEVEDLLKAGRIRALVATSSLELGIDMGAIDLVIQIEAPPSVASGLQRIGRSGHEARPQRNRGKHVLVEEVLVIEKIQPAHQGEPFAKRRDEEWQLFLPKFVECHFAFLLLHV
jgi:ATP-dependent Lhr-like helicase